MDVYSYVATLQALMLSCLYVEHVESVQQFLAPTVRILYMLKANPENSQRQNTLRKRHCFYDPIMQNEKKTVILSTFPTNSDHQRGKSDNCNYHNKISDDNIEIIDGLKPWQQQTQPSCGTFIIYLLYIYFLFIYTTPGPAAPRPLTKQKPQEHLTTCWEFHRQHKNLTSSWYTFEDEHFFSVLYSSRPITGKPSQTYSADNIIALYWYYWSGTTDYD